MKAYIIPRIDLARMSAAPVLTLSDLETDYDDLWGTPTSAEGNTETTEVSDG